MARLSVRLLGPPQIALDAEPITGFASDKVRALLAYLVVEAQQPHRREKLAGLLWPERPERSARGSLRQALANLRQVMSDHEATPPFFHITRQTIQFNRSSDAWIDATAFTDLVQAKGSSQQSVRQWEQAVELYRGDFLEGFSVSDSAAFEEWALLNRERLHRLVMEALSRLAEIHEFCGEFEPALQYAWRQVELDPWRENAHQQLMRLLALSGQRGAALAQYEACRRLIIEELNVEPAAETTRLYEQIRDGELRAPVPPPTHPPEIPAKVPLFLDREEQAEATVPVFVARERELAHLGGFLDLALAGKGRVVFVTGEAGSGKTALTQEFARRAQEIHDGLLIVGGNCNAYTGIGDPYLPFREVLGLLTGDVEARWAAGAVPREHAFRLWNTLPLAAQALLEAGPDLIDTFVPGRALLSRAAAFGRRPGEADWMTLLDQLVRQKAAVLGGPGPQQSALFQQYACVLQALARERPLVLVLDDLQWADAGSIDLLFHLGRRLAGSRILIIGAYRPEEVALGRHAPLTVPEERERHPLEPVVYELRRAFGEIAVDLGRAGGREFVEAYLDSEPNRLGAAFRKMLFQQTRGHPLFTVELLRGLQERGDLVQEEGQWVEGPALDWETLPARVEAVIAERIGRLADPLRDALRVASVEGEEFTAEVVARVQRTGEREMLSCLSGDLTRRHRLVQAQTLVRMREQRLSRYRFRHILFQKYLHSGLDPVARMQLHEDVGNALESLYGERAEEIAVQLARHFQEAGIAQKAAGYLYQAGRQAVRLSANEEAIAHFNNAVASLETLPETPERLEQELALQLDLTAPLEAARGFTAPETARAYHRAYELCQQIGETPRMVPAALSLGVYHYARGECHKALELTEQSWNLALRMEDPLMVATSRWLLGVYTLTMGDLEPALEHFEHVIAFYDPEQHASLAYTMAQDPGVSVLAWASWTLWLLGYPDRALGRSREAMALARQLDHPYTLDFALSTAGAFLHQIRGETDEARELNEAALLLSTEEGFPLSLAAGTVLRGWTLAVAGQADAGITAIHQGLDTMQGMGTETRRSHCLALLAEAHASAGQVAEGLSALDEALDHVQATGERYYEAEIHRLKGELLLMQGVEVEAETNLRHAEGCFQRAIEVSSRQRARSWELRATMSLARLWQAQGKGEAARKALVEIYGWFTEGYDTPDLGEAKALLEELA
jgi:DNA-binding SARP family transcriptional activator/predicted ATPase